MRIPNLYIIAGPNGAGKTTFAREFLPHFANCQYFVNADLIAQGLSPFAPEGMAMKAGRLLLEQIHDLAEKKLDFAFETTLSGKAYISFLKKLRNDGYKIHLFFLWIPDVELALARIKDRVSRGGHDVPSVDVRRRFSRGIKNLINDYRPLLDSWILFDNSTAEPMMIAREDKEGINISDKLLFEAILRNAER